MKFAVKINFQVGKDILFLSKIRAVHFATTVNDAESRQESAAGIGEFGRLQRERVNNAFCDYIYVRNVRARSLSRRHRISWRTRRAIRIQIAATMRISSPRPSVRWSVRQHVE
jgi:hypothetical protein